MSHVQTEDVTLARDTQTKALLTVDTRGRDAARQQRRQVSDLAELRAMVKELQEQMASLESLKSEFSALRREMEMTCR